MKPTAKKEIIFGAKRAGVTYLFEFDSSADLSHTRAAAKQLGLSLAEFMRRKWIASAPRLPKPKKVFGDSDQKSSRLKIEISDCDDFTRQCLERQAAYRGQSLQEYMHDCVLCQLLADEDASIFKPETEQVILQSWDTGTYRGCHVDRGAPNPPPSNFVYRSRPAQSWKLVKCGERTHAFARTRISRGRS